jgi:hypothetical protein
MRKRIALLISLSLAFFLAAQSLAAQVLDTTSFVVMGEGLAAGMANFGLSSVVQNQSFPARIAAQMGTGFEQPLIQPPGIGDVVGYPGQEVEMQKYPQGAMRQTYFPTDKTKAPIQTPPLLVMNTSVPGLTLADSISMKPVAPVVQNNIKPTVFNLILGYPQLILNNVPLWTQFEYAKALFPSVTLIELGYYEALNAAVAGDPTLMPDPVAFGATYSNVIAGFRNLQAQVIVTTIPNPIDTAYFSSPQTAASIVQTAPFILTAGFHVTAQDYITRNGLLAISTQFTNGAISALPPGSTMNAATALDITNRVNALNAQIVNAAKAKGAIVYDLNAFMHKVKVAGVSTGAGTVNGDYLGGFYSMDGIYPGATGHALIANDILTLLNTTYKRTFPLVDVKSIAANDPALQTLKPASTDLFTAEALGLDLQ